MIAAGGGDGAGFAGSFVLKKPVFGKNTVEIHVFIEYHRNLFRGPMPHFAAFQKIAVVSPDMIENHRTNFPCCHPLSSAIDKKCGGKTYKKPFPPQFFKYGSFSSDAGQSNCGGIQRNAIKTPQISGFVRFHLKGFGIPDPGSLPHYAPIWDFA
ncbi:MAG: hypothetical protein J5795_00310 [Lachnospiraceae bacterium]|nr:hypothetical protein [Lachnospiraceae bacterium]